MALSEWVCNACHVVLFTLEIAYRDNEGCDTALTTYTNLKQT